MALYLIFIFLTSVAEAISQEMNETFIVPTEHNDSQDDVVTGTSIDSLIHYFKVDPSDTLKIFGMFISWNVISQQLSRIARAFWPASIFTPSLRASQLMLVSPSHINHRRLAESLWRIVYHAAIGLYTGNLILTYSAETLLHPFLAWRGHADDSNSVPEEFVFLHAIEISFYLYVITDLVRGKDRLRHGRVTAIQNILLLMLIELLYNFHYYEVGLLIFLLHDITGFNMEITKGMIYLENVSTFYKYAAYCNFGTYVALCVYVSSYWFPRKIILYAAYLSMAAEPQPMIQVIAVVAIAVEIINIYWCLILIQWTKQVLYSNPYAQRSMLYRFLHTGSLKPSKVNGGAKANESLPDHVSPQHSRDAKALIQTVKCVMVMKRKLKRIREKKELQPGNEELLSNDSKEAGNELIMSTNDVWCSASAAQLSVTTDASDRTEIESMHSAEVANLIAIQVADEAAREEGADGFARGSTIEDLLNYDSTEQLITASEYFGSENGSLCESDDSMRVLYNVDSSSMTNESSHVGDNSSLYVDPLVEPAAQQSSKDLYESKKQSKTSEKGDVKS